MPNGRPPRAPALRRGSRTTFAALLGLSLAGCQTAAPDIAVPIPTAFRAAPSGRAAPVDRDWVKAFGSAELSRLAAAAAAENLDVAAAIARIDAAEAQAVVARSTLFPTLDSSADAARRQVSGAGRAGGRTTRSNAFALGLSASYELDLFGRNQFAADAADETARSVRFDRDALAIATTASVANTYLAVLAAQDRLRIAADNIRIAERVLEAVRGRLRVGTGTALDVAQQESVVATQRARVPPLTQSLAQNRNVLAVLLGRTPESVLVRGGSLDGLKAPVVRAGLPSQLLLRRPDLAAAEASLAAAELSVASARAAFFPTIRLTGGGGLQSAAFRSLFGGGALVYDLAAGLAEPIFDGFARQGRLDVQRGRNAELAANYKRAIVQALADVENALVAVAQTAEYERRQREAAAAARRALDIAEARLREGTTDIVTLFTTQNALFSAQDALVQVRLLRFQALVSLHEALGGGWTTERAAPVGAVEDDA